MDPLTHMALGAAAGEMILGRREGGRAVLVGALAGGMADLDIIPTIFMEQLSRMDVHRGYSHSLLFALLIAPILGFLIGRLGKGKGTARYFLWGLLVFTAILLHIGIDCLTTYGTRIFLPFSNYRVALSSIAIVDPFFTIPLLVSVLALVLVGTRTKFGKIIFVSGICISSLYLIFTLSNKLYIESVFARNLNEQHHPYARLFTTPLPFSNLLWVCVAEGADGYYMGYHSLLDKDRCVNFEIIAKNHDTINGITGDAAVKRLISITHGLYSIEKNESYVIFNDLRYGSRTLGMGRNDFMISYIIRSGDGKIRITRKSFGKMRFDEFPLLFRRILGEMGSG